MKKNMLVLIIIIICISMVVNLKNIYADTRVVGSVLDENLILPGSLTLGGNVAIGVHELQSTGNIVLQLGDASGANKLSIQDSASSEIFSVNSDGGVTATAGTFTTLSAGAGGLLVDADGNLSPFVMPSSANPYRYFNSTSGQDWWNGTNDSTSEYEVRHNNMAGNSVDLGINTSGQIYFNMVETVTTAGVTFTAKQVRNGCVVVTSAGTVTLPAVSSVGYGARVMFVVRDASETVIIEIDNADKINLYGTALDAGDTIDSAGAAGDVIELISTTDSDGSGTDGWRAIKTGGITWTDGGAT
jgi:hypothetical protein